jgi:predicted lipoprotein with Yx(FWY)xxD motif
MNLMRSRSWSKPRGTVALGVAAVALSLAACGSGTLSHSSSTNPTTSTAAPQAATASASASAVVVREVKNGKLGSVPVDEAGFTLYRFSLDKAGVSVCTSAQGCDVAWPPLLLPAGVTKPLGGPGVTGLATLKRSDGRLQVTYHGIPLYRFAGDKAAGQTNGQGIEGDWFAVTVSSTSAHGATTTTVAGGSSTTTSTGPSPTTSTMGSSPATTTTGPASTTTSTAPPATTAPTTTEPKSTTTTTTEPKSTTTTSPPTTTSSTTTTTMPGGYGY